MDTAGSDGQGEDADDVSSGACSRRAPHASERKWSRRVMAGGVKLLQPQVARHDELREGRFGRVAKRGYTV